MRAADVLHNLMALPPDERRAVAQRALESVEVPPELEEAQYQEALRRVRAVEEGKEELIDHEVVMAELRAIVRRART
jgi:putative addiction module component (TIGR02574 family)